LLFRAVQASRLVVGLALINVVVKGELQYLLLFSVELDLD